MNQGPWHFVGIGGIGMSALARILLQRGERVSGSDAKGGDLPERLLAEGARVIVGHDAQNIGDARTLVVSSAIDASNPEIAEARRRGLPIVHRGALLAEFLRARSGIAICGTHGKTTTTAMTHCLLRGSGIDAGLALGGIDAVLGTNAVDGGSPWFVTEADESDGSFALLAPRIAVLTNLENDHLCSDDEFPALVASFADFLAKLPEDGVAIVGMDNPHSASLARVERRSRTVTFGFTAEADLQPANVTYANLGSTFDVIGAGVCLGTIDLHVPGRINVENALAAIAVGRELGVPFARIARALSTFRGVRRRFDVLVRSDRMTVVDDYAHHPTAVRETIAAARRYHDGPIVVAFEPHRYSRTMYLANDFAQSLRGADTVYLAPVYAASEPPITGVSERSIGEPLRASGTPVQYVERVGDLVETLVNDAPHGALVLMLGAGTITAVAARLAQALTAGART